MSEPCQNLPAVLSTDETCHVLSVSPWNEDHTDLQKILRQTNWRFHRVRSVSEALKFALKNRPGVIVCERTLPDGAWRDVLSRTAELPDPPVVIVTAEDADNALWAEVLNLGGYDVLAKPFDHAEVVRAVSLAWMHWSESLSLRSAGEALRKSASTAGVQPTTVKTAGV